MTRRGLARPYLLQPTIMARIVDNGVAARDIAMVLRYGLLMLAVAAAGMGGATGRDIVSSIVSCRFGAQLRADLFGRITSWSFCSVAESLSDVIYSEQIS